MRDKLKRLLIMFLCITIAWPTIPVGAVDTPVNYVAVEDETKLLQSKNYVAHRLVIRSDGIYYTNSSNQLRRVYYQIGGAVKGSSGNMRGVLPLTSDITDGKSFTTEPDGMSDIENLRMFTDIVLMSPSVDILSSEPCIYTERTTLAKSFWWTVRRLLWKDYAKSGRDDLGVAKIAEYRSYNSNHSQEDAYFETLNNLCEYVYKQHPVDKDKIESAFEGNGNVTNVNDDSFLNYMFLNCGDNTESIADFISWFYLKTRDAASVVDPDADDKQAAGDAGSSTASAIQNNWYIAAMKVANDTSMDGSDWKLDDKYKKASGLDEIIGTQATTDDDWALIYDILVIAYSKGSDRAEVWDPNQEMYKQAYEHMCGKGIGLSPDGITTYQATLEDLRALESSGAEDKIKRIQSFYERIMALYHVSTLSGVDFDDDDYAWIRNYYEGNTDNMSLQSDLFPDDKDIGRFVDFDGTQIKDFPSMQKSGNIMVVPYLMSTVWEMPYITEYLAPELDSLIKNGSILSRQNLYDGLCGIKRAVDELGMPTMNTLWEREGDFSQNPDVTYKSLKALYEACQNSDEIKAEQSQEKTELSSGKPMSDFIVDYEKGALSENYVKAIAYTSAMVPMKTNVYSETWRATMEEEVKQQFYDLWGFHRKALYRDRTTGAGEKYYTTHKKSKGDLALCTLRDLLDSNGDIVLYLDDNFYNVAQLKENLNINPTYGDESLDDTTNTSTSTDKPWYQTLGSAIEDAFNASLENVLKTGANTNYSQTYYKMMSKLPDSHTYYPDADENNVGNTDSAVLPSGKINYYLKAESDGSQIYTPLQSYAVVSSIYRDGTLFDAANSETKQRPVFISSRTAPYAKGASEEQKMVIYNYALVKNLKASMPVGYSGNLDMDCPLYMDILGDIVTESGTVVIPAVSNATIMNHSDYNESLWGAGLFTVYGLDYQIPVKDTDSTTIGPVIDGIFEPDESGKHYVPVARTLGDDYSVDMSRLSATSKDTMQILYERSYNDLEGSRTSGQPLYDFDSYFQICMEVLRGAPIENIDKEAEGLETNSRINKAGIVAAAKLEELNKALGTNGENTTIALPNLAFMNGFNYIALIAFKLILLAVLVVNMITVYYDTVSESLTLGTFGKCLWSMVLTTAIIVTVPTVFDVTYYQANKSLLQNETSYISMLNLEKRESGVEIGVTEIKDPDTKTDVYVKLEDIDIPWYDLFYNSVHTDSYNSLNQMYETYAEEHSTIGKQDDVEIKNDGVYISTQTIFDSTNVDVNTDSSDANQVTLVQTAATSTSTFSFYSPYYAILDALITNVNYFNANPLGDDETGATQGWYSYTTKQQKGGKIKTMGLIEPYFTSSRFMEDDMKDPLGLKAIYSDEVDYDYLPDPATANLYTQRNKNAMLSSYWYPNGMSSTEIEKRITYLTKEARSFVANNKDLLGKISDETFLKVMALDIALKHNRIINAQHASAYEIANLSSDDIIKLSVAKRGEVMLNSALSYPRFIYTIGGTPAILVAAMLSVVMWVSSIVKPLLIIVAFITIFVSIFVFKICMRKPDVSVYGYLLTTLLLCATNILYAILLKLSLYLPNLGLTTFMCLIIQIIVQIVYMIVLLQVVWTAFRDWRNLGFTHYANKFNDLKIGLFNKLHRNRGEGNPNFEGSTRQSDPDTNWNYYDDMLKERERRNR